MNTNTVPVPNNQNPLHSYLRSPKLQLFLPSRGKFSQVKTQNEITGEIPIYPMTAKDEVMLRNPDALLNGESIVSVIKSVTGLDDIYNLSANDIDVILLAARYATYGNELDIETICEKCKHECEYQVSIEAILNTVKELDDEYIVELNNKLRVYLKPYTFRDSQLISMQAFRETNIINKLTASEDVDEVDQLKKFNKSFQAMADLNIKTLANSIIKIVIPGSNKSNSEVPAGEEALSPFKVADGTKMDQENRPDGGPILVTDQNHILEWTRGISREEADIIAKKANELNTDGIDREINIECPECNHQYKQTLEFNPASFFDIGS